MNFLPSYSYCDHQYIEDSFVMLHDHMPLLHLNITSEFHNHMNGILVQTLQCSVNSFKTRGKITEAEIKCALLFDLTSMACTAVHAFNVLTCMRLHKQRY
jgi:hypothetical protein